ncbi:hypothetical protein BH24ACI3_BH24ACI3_07140 [soil metagenome]
MRFLLSVILLSLAIFSTDALAQKIDVQTDLNGFRLKQYRSAVENELGAPDRGGPMGDEIEYEAFFLNEEPLLYMVFQYRSELDEVVWSIQLTGNDSRVDPGFKGLRLGMSEAEVLKALGTPSRKIDAGEHGTRWEFDTANYSVEINPSKKLSSIRIVDDATGTAPPDLKKVPDMKKLISLLTTGSNAQIAAVTAADMELYENEDTRYFRRALKNEIAADESKIFADIRRLAAELKNVNLGSEAEYEVNGRFRYGMDPMHVAKFKKTRSVREIVFQWNRDRWLIWEFNAGKPKSDSEIPLPAFKPGTLGQLTESLTKALLERPNYVLYSADKKPRLYLSYDPNPSKVDLLFTGETRSAPSDRFDLTEFWFKTRGVDKAEAANFKTEFKFAEGGKAYWVAVKNEEIEALKKLSKGSEVSLYVTWLGFLPSANGRESVFLSHKVEPKKAEGMIAKRVVNSHSSQGTLPPSR